MIRTIGRLFCRVLILACVVGAIAIVAATYVVDLLSMPQADYVTWCSSLSINATYILLIQVGAGLAMLILLRLSNHQSVLLNVAGACWCLIAFGNLAAIPVAYQASDQVSRFIELWAVRIHGLLVVSGICLLMHEWQASRKTRAAAQISDPSA